MTEKEIMGKKSKGQKRSGGAGSTRSDMLSNPYKLLYSVPELAAVISITFTTGCAYTTAGCACTSLQVVPYTAASLYDQRRTDTRPNEEVIGYINHFSGN